MVEICNEGCKNICERGDCEIKVALESPVDARKMASIIIEALGSEELRVVNEPRGRLLNALIEIAKWLGIEVIEETSP